MTSPPVRSPWDLRYQDLAQGSGGNVYLRGGDSSSIYGSGHIVLMGGRSDFDEPKRAAPEPVGVEKGMLVEIKAIPATKLPELLQYHFGIQPSLTYALVECFRCNGGWMTHEHNLNYVAITTESCISIPPGSSALRVVGYGFKFLLRPWSSGNPDEWAILDGHIDP